MSKEFTKTTELKDKNTALIRLTFMQYHLWYQQHYMAER